MFKVGENMSLKELTDLGSDVRREMEHYPSFTLFKSEMKIVKEDFTDEELGRKFLEWINKR